MTVAHTAILAWLQLIIKYFRKERPSNLLLALFGSDNLESPRNIQHHITFEHDSVYKPQTLAVSLDARKAFDRVEYCSVWCVKEIWPGGRLCMISTTLCYEPFLLARGTRQGCALSPLLVTIDWMHSRNWTCHSKKNWIWNIKKYKNNHSVPWSVTVTVWRGQ